MESKSMTYDQLMALFKETRESISQGRESDSKANREFRESDSKANREFRESMAESNRKLQKTVDQTSKQIAETNKRVAGISDTLGLLAEEQVAPKILEMFKKKGIELEEMSQNVVIKREGKIFAEIDILLLNSVYSVIVEVKNKLQKDDIDYHIERLNKLQKYPSKHMRGTTMYGAVAGMIVKEQVENYAIKKGLYLLKTKGDNIEIRNKPNFEPNVWKT